MAFLEIDNECGDKKESKTFDNLIKNFDELQMDADPIYENMNDIFTEYSSDIFADRNTHDQIVLTQNQSQSKGYNNVVPKKQTNKLFNAMELTDTLNEVESHYDAPKFIAPKSEPYYEVPKTKPIPLYENVEMFGNAAPIYLEKRNFKPPTEKPPPPPPDSENEDGGQEMSWNVNVKKTNSIKRIKKEIRNKRSSFLGIEGCDTDNFLEINVAPPPDMALFLEEEKKLERQLLLRTGFSDCSDTGM